MYCMRMRAYLNLNRNPVILTHTAQVVASRFQLQWPSKAGVRARGVFCGARARRDKIMSFVAASEFTIRQRFLSKTVSQGLIQWSHIGTLAVHSAPASRI